MAANYLIAGMARSYNVRDAAPFFLFLLMSQLREHND